MFGVSISSRCYSKLHSHLVKQPLNFVNGHRVDPVNCDRSQQFQLQYPATGEILRTVQSSGQDDIDLTVKAARCAQKQWGNMSGFERGKILKKAADILRATCAQQYLGSTAARPWHSGLSLQPRILWFCQCSGKPIWESRMDVNGCADTIEYYGGLAATIAGSYLQLSGGSFAYSIMEPLGVVAGIGAWNYPLQMASWKSAPALACGNAMIFKPSNLTPLTAVMLGEVYKEAGLPDGCYNVVQGEVETGSLLCHHPCIDKITFTGSSHVGSKVMEAAAKGIKHVTLELGGKSPLIIFNDSHIDNAVGGAMLANFLSQGQYVITGAEVGHLAGDQYCWTKKMIIGDPFKVDTTVGATISRQQADKVLCYIDNAKKEGASILYGGEEVTPEPRFSCGQFISPCILADCTDDMRIVIEEVFGSVMSVLQFDSEEEVITRANNTEFGLAGGVFTRDLARAHHVIAKLNAGSLYVNNYNVFPIGVPFGGYKKSGIGRENGQETLHYYTQVKSVYVEMKNVEAPF